MAKFYNIYIKPKEGITKEHVEKKMNLSLDWIRYDANCYVTYSTSDIEKWMVRLKPLVEPGGRLFISELNINNRNGWMTKDFWNWLKKER
jgi:hypothetical protein